MRSSQRSFATDYPLAQRQVLLSDRARLSSYCLATLLLSEWLKGRRQTPNTQMHRLQGSAADRPPARLPRPSRDPRLRPMNDSTLACCFPELAVAGQQVTEGLLDTTRRRRVSIDPRRNSPRTIMIFRDWRETQQWPRGGPIPAQARVPHLRESLSSFDNADQRKHR